MKASIAFLCSNVLLQLVSATPWEIPMDYTLDMPSYHSTGKDDCRVCFAAKQCYKSNTARCQYYHEAKKILAVDDETPKYVDLPLRAEVDSAIYDFIETAQQESAFKECIPYVSQYTNCNKDNVCTGCKTCDCGANGRWNCSISQRCRPEVLQPVADHRTLVMVMETLKLADQSNGSRKKRSILFSRDHQSREDFDRVDSMHEKLSEWMYTEPTLNVEPLENVKTFRDNNIYEDQHNHFKRRIVPKRFEPQRVKPFVYQAKAYTGPGRTRPRSKNNTELLKFIVNSLIQDALPGIFKNNAIDFETNRVKRWLLNNTGLNTKPTEPTLPSTGKITFQELSDWLSQIHPSIYLVSNGTDAADKAGNKNKETGNTHSATTLSPEYLAFEEVFGNLVVDNKPSTRRKLPPAPLDRDDDKADQEYNMYDDKFIDDSTTMNTPMSRPVKVAAEANKTLEFNKLMEEIVPPGDFEFVEPAEAVLQDNKVLPSSKGKVVVDLLQSLKKNELKGKESNNKADDASLNNIDEYSPVNIMKRDIKSIVENSTHFNMNDTTSESTNKINLGDSVNVLKDDVLVPLNNMLNDKQTEIEDLLKIRNNLIAFINTYRNVHLNTTDQNTFLSVYKVEITPQHHHDMHVLRTNNNTSILDKYRAKLKRDVYEVMRDIIAIRKLYHQPSDIPEEFKFLVRCMKHYIHKQGFHPKTRRSNDTKTNTIKMALINLIELLDKNQPQTNVLDFLPNPSKNILKRIIKKNHVDELAGVGLRLYDPQYNLTNDLANIGRNWQVMMKKIEKTSVFEKLYQMKRLQLTLASDIGRMKDALALIDYARTRRMVPADEVGTEKVILNLDNKLQSMIKRVTEIFDKHSSLSDVRLVVNSQSKKQKKKDSFLTQIKKLLQNSKKDILKLIHKNVPKTEIVKEIARKSIREDTNKNIQGTMEKWQNNLNVISFPDRKKRSMDMENVGRRIKSIIPKYLRGKVHPAITKEGKGKKINNKTSAEVYKKKNIFAKLMKKGQRYGAKRKTNTHTTSD